MALTNKLKQEYLVLRICTVLKVNKKSYYKWCENVKSIANNFKQEIADVISEAISKFLLKIK